MCFSCFSGASLRLPPQTYFHLRWGRESATHSSARPGGRGTRLSETAKYLGRRRNNLDSTQREASPGCGRRGCSWAGPGGQAAEQRDGDSEPSHPKRVPARNTQRKISSVPAEERPEPFCGSSSQTFYLVPCKKGSLKGKEITNKRISLQIICKGSRCIVNARLYPTGNLMNFIDCFCIAVCEQQPLRKLWLA